MRLGANKHAKNIKDVRSVFCSDGGGGRDAVDEHTKAEKSKPQTQFPYHIIVTTSSMFLLPGVHILHKRI